MLEIVVLGFLGLLSAFVGFIAKDLFLGLGSNYFSLSLAQLPSSWSFLNTEFIPAVIKMVPVLTSLLAFFIAIKFTVNYDVNLICQTKTYFEMCKWFYNEILNQYFVLPSLFYGRHGFEQLEKRNLELNGPLFLTDGVIKLYSQAKINIKQ